MTDQVRYKERPYSPGPQSFGKPIIERFDQNVKDTWDGIQSKRRELQSLLNRINQEAEQVKANAIGMVVEDCDYQEYLTRLVELRLEAEILEGAINHLNNQGDALKRGHPWLSAR